MRGDRPTTLVIAPILVFEMSAAIGPSDPNAATNSFAIRFVAPVLVSAVASGSMGLETLKTS